MPFIHIRTNRPVSPEAESAMARQLGRDIALLGKSEAWLMLQFEENCRLYFKGDSQNPLAFVSVRLYGKADPDACARLTGNITRMLGDILSVPPDCVYVAYGETEHWGWNGSNF